MCVGRYIHYIYKNQDIRLYLSIKKNNYYFFNFKIMWILVGYYSKDLIIESFF